MRFTIESITSLYKNESHTMFQNKIENTAEKKNRKKKVLFIISYDITSFKKSFIALGLRNALNWKFIFWVFVSVY